MEKLGALYQYLRRNINGLASQLALAYNTAISSSLDPSELNKLRSRVLRIEAFVQQNGGDVQDLRNAIATGATNPIAGLGEPVTATAATTAASGFIATVVAWLKDVDWGKLAKKAPDVINTAQDIRNSLKPNESPTTSSPTSSSSGGMTNKYNQVQIPTPNNEAGSNKIMWLLGTLAVAGGGLYYWKTQQKTTNQPNRAK